MKDQYNIEYSDDAKTLVSGQAIELYSLCYFVKDGTTRISDNAFCYNSKIKSIVLPSSLKYIGENAFMGSSIESVYMRDNIEEIGPHCFKDCINLKDVNLSDRLTFLPEELFYGCSKLKNIKLPRNIVSIKDLAFCCTELEEINFPNSLKNIGNEAFSCTKLRSIFIPASVTEIGYAAFESCEELVYAHVESKIKEIPVRLFNGCKKLEYIKFSDTIKEVGQDALSYTNLEQITLPAGMKIIPNGMISGNFQVLNIPDSIEEIGNYSISSRNLLEIRLPKNLKDIERLALNGCNSLSYIYIDKDMKYEGQINLTNGDIDWMDHYVPFDESIYHLGDLKFSEIDNFLIKNVNNIVETIEDKIVDRTIKRIDDNSFIIIPRYNTYTNLLTQLSLYFHDKGEYDNLPLDVKIFIESQIYCEYVSLTNQDKVFLDMYAIASGLMIGPSCKNGTKPKEQQFSAGRIKKEEINYLLFTVRCKVVKKIRAAFYNKRTQRILHGNIEWYTTQNCPDVLFTKNPNVINENTLFDILWELLMNSLEKEETPYNKILGNIDSDRTHNMWAMEYSLNPNYFDDDQRKKALLYDLIKWSSCISDFLSIILYNEPVPVNSAKNEELQDSPYTIINFLDNLEHWVLAENCPSLSWHRFE